MNFPGTFSAALVLSVVKSGNITKRHKTRQSTQFDLISAINLSESLRTDIEYLTVPAKKDKNTK